MIYPDVYHYLVDTECVYTRGMVEMVVWMFTTKKKSVKYLLL